MAYRPARAVRPGRGGRPAGGLRRDPGGAARGRAGPGLGGGTAPRPPVTNRPDPEQWAALEAALPEQPWHAAAILAGHTALSGWWGAGRAADWSDAVQAGRTLAAAAGVPVEVNQAEMAPWHPGRCAAFTIGGQVVGYAGELHPKVVDALDLPRRTCALEIDLSAVLAVPRELASTPVVSPFPVAPQDVAPVV